MQLLELSPKAKEVVRKVMVLFRHLTPEERLFCVESAELIDWLIKNKSGPEAEREYKREVARRKAAKKKAGK